MMIVIPAYRRGAKTYNPCAIYIKEVMNMSVIKTYSANGATVNFHDDGYINSAKAELEYRRENMQRNAEQIAQESELRRLRKLKQADSPQTP